MSFTRLDAHLSEYHSRSYGSQKTPLTTHVTLLEIIENKGQDSVPSLSADVNDYMPYIFDILFCNLDYFPYFREDQQPSATMILTSKNRSKNTTLKTYEYNQMIFSLDT